MCPSPPWFHYPERRLLAGFLGLLWSVLAGGCATTTAPVAPDTIAEVLAAPEPEASEYIPVVRYARYTLVELAPMAAQRDLLLQTIDVSMPEDARATVGDGLRHVLKRSGYGLCQTAHAVIELYALPLPAAPCLSGPPLQAASERSNRPAIGRCFIGAVPWHEGSCTLAQRACRCCIVIAVSSPSFRLGVHRPGCPFHATAQD